MGFMPQAGSIYPELTVRQNADFLAAIAAVTVLRLPG